ncbi:MAG: LysE family transporter [Deltaproteobacteria bacterium]|nr:LysE family transporter [Deltaproteobacteria bacterium]
MLWPLVGIFVSSFVVGLSGALMPGPVLTVTIAETTRRGFWAGPLIVLGHGIIEFALFVALVLGLGAFLENDLVFGIVGVGGAIVLMGMGAGMLWGTKTATLKLELSEGERSRPVIAGLLTSISNPYFIIWWATIGLSFIATSQRLGIMGLGSFYSGHIMSDVVWYFAVAWAVTMGKRIMNDHVYRWIIGLCGGFLVLLGVYFGYSGLDKLLKTLL